MRIYLEKLRLKIDWDFIALLLFLILLIIKIIYPPFLSVVVSPSMEHTNFNCNKYIKYNITCEEFSKFPFSNGINVGDVVIILPVNVSDLRVGDVILYRGVDGREILHRIIKIYDNHSSFLVMGDNNPGPLIYQGEYNLSSDRIIGKAVFVIPYIGYPRVWIKNLLGI